MAWPTTLFVGCGSTASGGFVYTVCGYPKGANQDGKEIGTPAATAAGNDAVLKDQKFRQAMLEAINRQSIVDNIAAGHTATPATFDPDNPNTLASSLSDVDPDLKSPNSTIRARPVGGDYGAETPVTFGADVDLVNKYIWRGFDLNDQPALQPNIWTSAYGFAASAWFQVAVNQLSDPLGLDIDEDEPICRYHRLEPGISASYDLGSNALHKQNYIYPLVDSLADEGPMNDRLWSWGSGNYQKIEGSDDAPVNTAVQPPDLTGLPPAYDPAAPRPYDPDCVM
jgi:ABC-type transport system substrate-binding protein